ncbi:MAG: response regulator [Deltaproteobacteria bacterium]|nr:response regulator [Deltaproteobacteria bacterium]
MAAFQAPSSQHGCPNAARETVDRLRRLLVLLTLPAWIGSSIAVIGADAAPVWRVLAAVALLVVGGMWLNCFRTGSLGIAGTLVELAAIGVVLLVADPSRCVGLVFTPVTLVAFRALPRRWLLVVAYQALVIGAVILAGGDALAIAVGPAFGLAFTALILHVLVRALEQQGRDFASASALAVAGKRLASARTAVDEEAVLVEALGVLVSADSVRIVAASDGAATDAAAVVLPIADDRAVVARKREGEALPTSAIEMLRATHAIAAERRAATERAAEALQALHRRELERRDAQRLEALGRFAGGIAHDFSNVLACIGSYTDLLLDALPELDPNRSDLQEIRRATDTAAELTGKLLAFARRQNVPSAVLDLGAVLSRSLPMFRQILPKTIDLVVALDDDLPRVRADKSQIEQIVTNLVFNARDACEATGGVVSLRASAAPGGVYLEVRDTGVGMTDAVRARLFEPFFTTKRRGKGTGLGLATAHGIVSQLGGRIEVESAPGAGAAFRVHLPAVAEDGPASVAAMPAVGATVLVVDDEDGVRNAVVRMLTLRGYRALPARGGEEALAIVEAADGPLDLVLTDMVMPGMNGRELIERLRAESPSTRVAIISGHDFGELRDLDVPVLAKPFTPEALARHVARALRADREAA